MSQSYVPGHGYYPAYPYTDLSYAAPGPTGYHGGQQGAQAATAPSQHSNGVHRVAEPARGFPYAAPVASVGPEPSHRVTPGWGNPPTTHHADELDTVVEALRRISGPSLQASLEAGETIFRHVFKGDEALLKARGKKCSSFRKLAAHPNLAMSSSSLWRAVAIYELSLRFPELAEYVHVGVGHISVVLGLPSADQFSLLRSTESQRWTRRKLQKVVADMRSSQRGNGDLPTSKVAERLAGMEMLAKDVILDRQLAQMSSVEARTALQTLARIRDAFTRVEGKLHQATSN